jgi:hypothetical protein
MNMNQEINQKDVAEKAAALLATMSQNNVGQPAASAAQVHREQFMAWLSDVSQAENLDEAGIEQLAQRGKTLAEQKQSLLAADPDPCGCNADFEECYPICNFLPGLGSLLCYMNCQNKLEECQRNCHD